MRFQKTLTVDQRYVQWLVVNKRPAVNTRYSHWPGDMVPEEDKKLTRDMSCELERYLETRVTLWIAGTVFIGLKV